MSARGLGYRLFGARAFATVEDAWPHLAPAVGVAVLFVGLSWLDLWSMVPVWAHVAGLVLFAVLLVAALWRGARGLRPASRARAVERLERDNGLRHQPLGSIEDTLPASMDDPLTRRLWRRHKEQALARLSRLRLTPPRSAMPRVDPWAVRALLGLLLLVALVEARGSWIDRLAAAFRPSGAIALAAAPLRAELWVTPPAYTGVAPIGGERTAGVATLRVPQGSEALLQLHGLPEDEAAMPAIRFADEPVAIEPLGRGSGQARLTLERDGDLVVADTPDETRWTMVLVPDTPPRITFAEEPKPTSRAALEVPFEASDDYGLAILNLSFALIDEDRVHEDGVEEDGVEEDAVDETSRETVELLAPSAAPRHLATSVYVDLSAHPFAGLPVSMRLLAEDALGQIGSSEALVMVLPERRFAHPLARAVVAVRKDVVARPEQDRRSFGRLYGLAQSEPARKLGVAVELALATSASRLREVEDAAGRRSVVDLLWEIALYIEDGALSLAEKELRELQEALQKALLEGADDAELEELMDRLQAALDAYLQEMMRQAMERGRQPVPPDQQTMPLDPSQTVTGQELQEMLDRARELMRSGAKDAAQQMLAQLQNMLENLQTAQPRQQPSQAEQAMSDLQRMIELQQDLLDRSFQMQQGQQQQGGQQQQEQRQQGQQGQQGQPQQGMPEGGSRQAAGEQEALRRALGELMRRMGEMGMDIPRALGQAELQMRGAGEALQGDRPGQAIDPQGQAVDLMRQGGQAMMEQLREMMAQQQGQGRQGQQDGMQGRQGQRPGRDPFGRASRNDGGFDTDGTEVPVEADLGRARDVLEELFRRSRDRTRPTQELDYYDRLLDRF